MFELSYITFWSLPIYRVVDIIIVPSSRPTNETRPRNLCVAPEDLEIEFEIHILSWGGVED
jgi:hypothetical protein